MINVLLFKSKILFSLDNMAKLKIETGEENEILRTISDPIRQDEIRKYRSLADDMIKHIKNPANAWVGLAAPQIGVNKRLIVVSLMRDYEDEDYRTIAMLNPEIIEHADELCSDKEWCLSVPGETGEVERWSWVKVAFSNPDGKKYVMKLENLAARIVQHEIDHLDGVLFTDKIERTVL
jgi:peptide deformylase